MDLGRLLAWPEGLRACVSDFLKGNETSPTVESERLAGGAEKGWGSDRGCGPAEGSDKARSLGTASVVPSSLHPLCLRLIPSSPGGLHTVLALLPLVI